MNLSNMLKQLIEQREILFDENFFNLDCLLGMKFGEDSEVYKNFLQIKPFQTDTIHLILKEIREKVKKKRRANIDSNTSYNMAIEEVLSSLKSRENLETKVVEGAKKVVEDFGNVFKRLK